MSFEKKMNKNQLISTEEDFLTAELVAQGIEQRYRQRNKQSSCKRALCDEKEVDEWKYEPSGEISPPPRKPKRKATWQDWDNLKEKFDENSNQGLITIENGIDFVLRSTLKQINLPVLNYETKPRESEFLEGLDMDSKNRLLEAWMKRLDD